MIETRTDDRFAHLLKAHDVEHDVVVHEENGPCTVPLSVADIFDDAVHCKNVKISTAHFDDRTKAAIERAAARGFDHIDRPSEHGVSVQNASGTVRQFDLVFFEALDRRGRVVNELFSPPEGQAGNSSEITIAFEDAQQLSKGRFTFPTNYEIDERSFLIGICVCGETRVVSTQDDAGGWSQ